MKQKTSLIPGYSVVPLAVSVILNMLTYYATRLVTQSVRHFDFTLPVDGWIPFVPAAVLIYVLAFVSWVVGFVVVCRESREVCYRVLAGEQTAKLLCLVIFLTLPTTMVRPEVTGSGFFCWLTRFIYRMDTPDNLLPSIHCLENWILFRGAIRCRKVGKGYKLGYFIFTLMVFASTLLVKQHLAVDVVAAIIVAELGFWLADRLKTHRIYEILEGKWCRSA